MSPNSHHIFPFKLAADGEEQRTDSEAQEVQGVMTQTVCLNVTKHFILVFSNKSLSHKMCKHTQNVQGHKKELNHQRGQEIKKPIGPYGEEASGINVTE